MTYDLKGKNVLVTGASGGIGAALAEGFAARGATVGICARRTDRLEEVLARVASTHPSRARGRSISPISTRSTVSRAGPSTTSAASTCS